ncbi:MAG: response regulator [Chloroflexi bacterium]|nr:response regulator [Chloroflexota bacterium]MBI5715523.1 response regulator [Chloroflexota bacterium]
MARILYIEDDPGMIDLVTTIVTRRGYEITGAVGGHQGLEILRSQAKKPDLILLDLMMPDIDGWEVYQQIKANEATKDIPVIIVTAKAQNIDKVLGLQIAKVDDYVTKPFGPQDLVGSIEKVLGKGK